jgi:hypothetical protein
VASAAVAARRSAAPATLTVTMTVAVVGLTLAGCGLRIQAPDLFLLTRTGGAGRLTLLVNDAGTIRCDGGKPRPLAGSLLLRARDLAPALDADAKRGLRLPSPPGSVFRYTIRLPHGTISFPDTAGHARHELAQVELFAVEAAQQACGLPG